MAPAMLRVMPTGDLPVPSHDGTKLRHLKREGAPAAGHMVPDNLHNRRRILFGELLLLAEGDAALPKAEPDAPAAATPPALVPPPAPREPEPEAAHMPAEEH
jgi:hypothetical protein